MRKHAENTDVLPLLYMLTYLHIYIYINFSVCIYEHVHLRQTQIVSGYVYCRAEVSGVELSELVYSWFSCDVLEMCCSGLVGVSSVAV